ncbi:hypothetical protein [Pseudocitrobacter cyperus]|uniref:Oligosaccharide repeat unit polymerase n=1 Tax=Pseudocitrobacter cyperus TaxID=3112843 RepID=A0ABV0HMK0_9ENTR
MLYFYGVFAFFSLVVISLIIIRLIKKQPVEYHAYLVYTLLFGTLSGVIFAPFFLTVSPRFEGISLQTSILITLFTVYSILILLVPFIFSRKSNTRNNGIDIREKTVVTVLFVLSLCYLVLRMIAFYKLTPLFAALQGDLLQAARLRQMTQLKENNIDFPYIGAVFKSFSIVCVYYYFIIFLRFRICIIQFIIAFMACAISLTLDLQKAPVFLMLINMLLIYVYYHKVNIKVLAFSIILIAGLTLCVVFITGSDNPFDSFVSIFDRVIFGQNQGMYYMLEFLSPTTDGFFYNFYFSSLDSVAILPPNIRVIDFIPYYWGNATLVNVNTFIVGDAWSFFGWAGMIVSPIICALIFWLQMYCFERMKKYGHILFTSLAISFFSFYPVNRSLAEILTLKYFLHYICFAMIPIFIIMAALNVLAVKR